MNLDSLSRRARRIRTDTTPVLGRLPLPIGLERVPSATHAFQQRELDAVRVDLASGVTQYHWHTHRSNRSTWCSSCVAYWPFESPYCVGLVRLELTLSTFSTLSLCRWGIDLQRFVGEFRRF